MWTERQIVQRITPSDSPFTKICVGDEEVLVIPKDGNWEIARVFFDYLKELCDELVVVFKRKGEANERSDSVDIK